MAYEQGQLEHARAHIELKGFKPKAIYSSQVPNQEVFVQNVVTSSSSRLASYLVLLIPTAQDWVELFVSRTRHMAIDDVALSKSY